MPEKSQRERFEEAARELECDESEGKFNANLRKIIQANPDKKVCPECGHVFKGKGWDGIDAHWRSPKTGHEDVMPYEEAWPLLSSGKYRTG